MCSRREASVRFTLLSKRFSQSRSSLNSSLLGLPRLVLHSSSVWWAIGKCLTEDVPLWRKRSLSHADPHFPWELFPFGPAVEIHSESYRWCWNIDAWVWYHLQAYGHVEPGYTCLMSSPKLFVPQAILKEDKMHEPVELAVDITNKKPRDLSYGYLFFNFFLSWKWNIQDKWRITYGSLGWDVALVSRGLLVDNHLAQVKDSIMRSHFLIFSLTCGTRDASGESIHEWYFQRSKNMEEEIVGDRW